MPAQGPQLVGCRQFKPFFFQAGLHDVLAVAMHFSADVEPRPDVAETEATGADQGIEQYVIILKKAGFSSQFS